MTHKCHAHGCPLSVPPKFLFCARHWHMTRKALQNAIWNEYRVGQEESKEASDRYMAIQRLCVSELAHRLPSGSSVALRYAEQAEAYRKKAMESGAGDPFEQLSRRKKKSEAQLELGFAASNEGKAKAS